eukprot:1563810-Rhodomonas_salina.1
MQPGRKRTMLEQTLGCMRNDILLARREELRLARLRTAPTVWGLKIRRQQRQLRLTYPSSRISTCYGTKSEQTLSSQQETP